MVEEVVPPPGRLVRLGVVVRPGDPAEQHRLARMCDLAGVDVLWVDDEQVAVDVARAVSRAQVLVRPELDEAWARTLPVSVGRTPAEAEARAALDPALARYGPNGALDPSFSGDGRQTTDFPGFENWASGVALQGNKIVTVGSGDDDFALARYNPSGSLDPTFSGDGKQTTDFGGVDVANALALQPNGKIVAVGIAAYRYFALARYRGG